MPNKRKHVALPGDLVAAIDHLVGKLRLLENPEPIWKVEDHPELKDGAAAWVERLRAADEKLDRRRHGC